MIGVSTNAGSARINPVGLNRVACTVAIAMGIVRLRGRNTMPFSIDIPGWDEVWRREAGQPLGERRADDFIRREVRAGIEGHGIVGGGCGVDQPSVSYA